MNEYKSISSGDANEHKESRRMEVKPLHLLPFSWKNLFRILVDDTSEEQAKLWYIHKKNKEYFVRN